MSRSLSCHIRSFTVVISMDVSTAEGLADHAETLSDYLYEYGGDPEQRGAHSTLFFEYLLSACWPKLYRRFTSWQGLALIQTFEERVDLLTGHLNMIGTSAGPSEEFMHPGPGDRTLAYFLELNSAGIFTVMLPLNLPESVMPCQPTEPFHKLRKAVDTAKRENDLSKLYSAETSMDFHFLIYCAFLLAGRAIRQIKDNHVPLKRAWAKKDKAIYDSLVVKFKDSIVAAVLPMKILHCVLSSTAFKRHIRIWTNDGESLGEIWPKWSRKKENLEFGIKRQILSKFKKGPSDERSTEGGDEGDTPKESSDDDDTSGFEVWKAID